MPPGRPGTGSDEAPGKASPATRMMELLHSTDVRLGLVANGEHWMLVDAPRGEATGFASWYAGLWLEEKATLQAFRSLLGVHRGEDYGYLSRSLRSFAEVASALARADYRAVAERNAEFLLGELQRDGRILRTYRRVEAKIAGYLEGYSNLVDGLISLYEATFEPRWIEEAERLAGLLVTFFGGDEGLLPEKLAGRSHLSLRDGNPAGFSLRLP